MYYDLNIKFSHSVTGNRCLEEVFIHLLEYGYEAVALIVEVDESIFACRRDKSKNRPSSSTEAEPIPPPPEIQGLKEKFPKLNIYRRINVILSETENVRKVLQCKNLKRYDLISFQPESQGVLRALKAVAEVDIISYNPESKFILSINRKLYNQFTSQDVYFELLYAPAVISQSSRRNLITLSHVYHAVGRSRNIIVSSGTQQPHHIRGPYDVMNFNLLFGLTEGQAKKAISSNCEKLLLKARRQRSGKSMVEITPIGHGDERKDDTSDESESEDEKMESMDW